MWTSSLSTKSVLVIIPAYNEEQNIKLSVDKLLNSCKYDYLIVDDGSTDKTFQVCLENNYHVVRHAKNKGLSQAVRTGITYAWEKGYKYVAQYDADGQHNPIDLINMVNYIQKEKIDIVCGTRFGALNKQHHKNIFKEIVRQIFVYIFFKKTKIKITDPTNGLRVFGKNFINQYFVFPKYEVEPSTIAYTVEKKNLKVAEIHVNINKRQFGKSKFSNLFQTIKYVNKQLEIYTFASKKWKY